MIERLDPARIVGESAESVAQYIESDYKIRSGLCPNDCGLLTPTEWGQECRNCGFLCNTKMEKGTAQ